MDESVLKISRPFGPPIGMTKMPVNVINKINAFVDSDEEEKLNHGPNLIGQVKEEIRLPSKLVNGEIMNFLSIITNSFIKNLIKKEISKFELLNAWVVRQYENEYNPPHFHSGHLSGVGYLKLPDSFGPSIQNEKKLTPHGEINFFFGSKHFLSEGTRSIKPKVGDFYIFPNYMEHSVNPFYGEGERRSLSFNAIIDQKIYDVYGHIG